jgi:hypothetical protein
VVEMEKVIPTTYVEIRVKTVVPGHLVANRMIAGNLIWKLTATILATVRGIVASRFAIGSSTCSLYQTP